MTIKTLLVGCGEHSAENLIPSLMAINTIEVSGLADPSHDALRKAHRWFPDARLIRQEILTASDVSPFDAIVVAAPPQVHELMARLAIDNGKPIFVEKPPTVHTEELQTLAAAAKQKNIVTCVGHNLRHSDAAIQFRNAIVSPGFGRPIAMEMRYLASKPRGPRWGIESPLRSFLLSHANHAIDLMIYQLGDLEEVVAARAWPDVNGGIAITAQFIFRSGAIGTLLATSYAPYFNVSASVVSNAGNLASLSGLHDVQVVGPNELGKRWGNMWRPRTLEGGYRFAGYQTELERFFNAITSRSPENVHPSFADEVSIYKAMDDIERYIEMAGAKRGFRKSEPHRF
jgi:phthalate 4,5-cis-dihydrodiol dehydrogenase